MTSLCLGGLTYSKIRALCVVADMLKIINFGLYASTLLLRNVRTPYESLVWVSIRNVCFQCECWYGVDLVLNNLSSSLWWYCSGICGIWWWTQFRNIVVLTIFFLTADFHNIMAIVLHTLRVVIHWQLF
jgi:hypothetical protein